MNTNTDECDIMARDLSFAECYCFKSDVTTALEEMIKNPYVTPLQMKRAIHNAEFRGFADSEIVKKAKDRIKTITMPDSPAHYTHAKLVDVIQHLQHLVYDKKDVSVKHLDAAIRNMQNYGLQNYEIYDLANDKLNKIGK